MEIQNAFVYEDGSVLVSDFAPNGTLIVSGKEAKEAFL